MKNRRVVTVDGLAGCGKTSLAKALAEKLGYFHLSTGLLYRAVGFLALREGVAPEDPQALAILLSRHEISLELPENSKSAVVIIDGKPCGEELHTPEVSESTSKSAQFPQVRSALVEPQRQAFSGRNLVVEGRDMGTVIFPEADLKFFIDTPPAVRVERRIAQLYGEVSEMSPEELNQLKSKMEIEVIERDKRDSTRDLAPAVPADGAIIVDNSSNPLISVVESMYHHALERGLAPGKS